MTATAAPLEVERPGSEGESVGSEAKAAAEKVVTKRAVTKRAAKKAAPAPTG